MRLALADASEYRRALQSWLALPALCLVLLACAASLSWRLERFHKDEGEARYPVPKLEVMQSIATGFDNLLADGFWLQFLQYDGSKLTEDMATRRFEHLWEGLRLITGLDPRFTDAYLFGSWVLCDAGYSRQAERLLQLGRRREGNPRIDFQLGFVRFLYLHDYPSALAAFAACQDEASRPPCFDSKLANSAARMSAGMAERHHQARFAHSIWVRIYDQARAADDKRMAQIASRAIRRLEKQLPRWSDQ